MLEDTTLNPTPRAEIEAANNTYENAIEAIAIREFKLNIEPYLIEHKLDFVTGNGAVVFCTTEHTDPEFAYEMKLDIGLTSSQINPYRLPEKILDLINLDLINIYWSLGDFMPTWRYEDYETS